MIDTLPIAHYRLMLFELLSVFTTLPFSFILISCNNNSLASFFEDHTSHLASRLSSMERDAKAAVVSGEKEWLPSGKTYGKQKKVDNNYWTSRYFFFRNLMFIFWGWRIFESIKWQIFFSMAFRSLESSFHCDDVRRNWHPYNPWSRSTRSRLVDQGREVKMVGDGNPWNLRLDYCEWENLECLFQRHFDVEAFGFLEVPTHLMMCICW